MNLNELKEKWANDCIMGDDWGAEAAKCPALHSFYINETISYKLQLTKIQLENAQLVALKGKYFRGELTTAELKDLGWDQWQFRTLKADIGGLIDADLDVQKLIAREQFIKTIIYFLESVISEIKNRNFLIKSAIDWQRFRAGT